MSTLSFRIDTIMTSNKQSSKNGVILVTAGLVGGIIIGAGSLYAVLGHSQSAAANPALETSAVTAALPAAAAPQAQASPAPAPAIAQPVASMQPQYESLPVPAGDYGSQPAQAYGAEPGGQTGVEYSVTTSGSGGVYTQVTPTFAASPNWSMGSNGLIQNPCVDPPSSHGRAYYSGSY